MDEEISTINKYFVMLLWRCFRICFRRFLNCQEKSTKQTSSNLSGPGSQFIHAIENSKSTLHLFTLELSCIIIFDLNTNTPVLLRSAPQLDSAHRRRLRQKYVDRCSICKHVSCIRHSSTPTNDKKADGYDWRHRSMPGVSRPPQQPPLVCTAK